MTTILSTSINKYDPQSIQQDMYMITRVIQTNVLAA